MKLIIASRNLSTWSLRPWLTLKQAGLPFEEVLIPLNSSHTREEILKYSPSGWVPCLIDGDTLVWDSLAICEYVAEQVPFLLPSDRKARAEARSISAEMHSGFAPLRRTLPMNIQATPRRLEPPAEVAAEIARIIAIWENCRSRYASQGPFLFGQFTFADAMFAPLVWRFRTYCIELPEASNLWAQTMLALPAMQEWRQGALAEPPS